MSHAESGRDPPAQELAHEQGDLCPIPYGECRDSERTKDASCGMAHLANSRKAIRRMPWQRAYEGRELI